MKTPLPQTLTVEASEPLAKRLGDVTKGVIREYLRGDLSQRGDILFRILAPETRRDLANQTVPLRQLVSGGCHTLKVTCDGRPVCTVVTHRHPSGVVMAVVS